MNIQGVLVKIAEQAKAWKHNTGNTAAHDGLAIMMSEQTWAKIAEYTGEDNKMIYDQHVIITPGVPDGQTFFVVPEGHRFMTPKKNQLQDPFADGGPLTDTSGWVAHHSGPVTYTTSANSGVFFAPNKVEGLYQHAPPAPWATDDLAVNMDEFKAHVDLFSPGSKLPSSASIKAVKETLGPPPSGAELDEKAKTLLNKELNNLSCTAITWLPGDGVVPIEDSAIGTVHVDYGSNKMMVNTGEGLVELEGTSVPDANFDYGVTYASGSTQGFFNPSDAQITQLKKALAGEPKPKKKTKPKKKAS